MAAVSLEKAAATVIGKAYPTNGATGRAVHVESEVADTTTATVPGHLSEEMSAIVEAGATEAEVTVDEAEAEMKEAGMSIEETAHHLLGLDLVFPLHEPAIPGPAAVGPSKPLPPALDLPLTRSKTKKGLT